MSDFELTHELLNRLTLRNNFAVPDNGVIFFGIRGALPIDITGTDFAESHRLRFADLDNVHMRCTLGQWQPGKGTLAVFPGSTVPTRKYVANALGNQGRGVNMLMLGLYEYQRGTHKVGQRSGHRAFRQAKFFPVWRTSDDLDFDLDDRVDLGSSANEFFWDNLHSAYHDNLETPGYSSAGCQVVCGLPKAPYRNNMPDTGPWKRFLDNAYTKFGDQARYPYALFSAFEAGMLATRSDDEISQSARFGSTGPLVDKLQAALNANGYDIGRPDGELGRNTLEALMAFQKRQGGAVDGILGPNTAASLGIELPKLSAAIPAPAGVGVAVTPSPAIAETPTEEDTPLRPALAEVEEADSGASTGAPHVVDVAVDSNGNWTGTVDGGAPFYIGKSTNWQNFKGIFQPAARLDSIPGGTYSAAEWEPRLGDKGKWAWFLLPTIMAESGGHFGRVNTYDGAGLTFGMIQFASHTPKDNLILLFRRLLAMPDASRWFPELVLQNGKVTLKAAGGLDSLEVEADGRLKKFMNYLNPDAKSVDRAEALSAARLIAWAADSNEIKRAQIDVAIERLSYKVDRLRTKYEVDLARFPIYTAIWAADILHHGRAKYAVIRDAFASSNPEAKLAAIGQPAWKDRLQVVSAEVARLKAGGQLDGLRWGTAPLVLTP